MPAKMQFLHLTLGVLFFLRRLKEDIMVINILSYVIVGLKPIRAQKRPRGDLGRFILSSYEPVKLRHLQPCKL